MAVTLTPYVSQQRVVAAGNNEIWYEDIDVSAGSMTELVAANGDIDTTDQLMLVPAFQQVFVINGANLKVADFVNTKLTHGALATPHAVGDLLTQDQGGGDIAYMTVVYTNAAKTNTYGFAFYAGSATAFNASDSVTGSGDGSSFTPSAVTAPPHWHDFTVYQGDTDTYGTLPNKAYIGCLYNGRLVLSGNPENPYQWYMSRHKSVYDWAYAANDDLSPIYGGIGDAGELGDIVRALIPYKDDFLVFGCADSMWVLYGNPARGGEIRELSLTTGIFCATAYCWDNMDRLYFWGNNGLYRTTIPGVPVCVSQYKLPRLVKDEAANPSTHRITLTYDRDRHGIVVAITKLSDGSNSNYWYDLNALDDNEVGAFFPEAYPTQCGVYSSIYYAANDATLKAAIYGCKDGYIRYFDDAAKSDDIGDTDQAVDSYITVGPFALSQRPRHEGILNSIDMVTAGGGSDGSQSDSDDVYYRLYAARTSAKVLEKFNTDTNPQIAGTFVGPGNLRGTTRRQTIRDMWAGIKIGNDTAAQTWAIEDIVIDIKESGRAV